MVDSNYEEEGNAVHDERVLIKGLFFGERSSVKVPYVTWMDYQAPDGSDD